MLRASPNPGRMPHTPGQDVTLFVLLSMRMHVVYDMSIYKFERSVSGTCYEKQGVESDPTA